MYILKKIFKDKEEVEVKENKTLELFKEHVNYRKKNGDDILNSLDGKKCDLLHMAVGTSTEANELLDAVKKHIFYEKELDIKNVREEIGDVLFYLQGVMNILNIDLEKIMKENMDKLNIRYPKGFSNEDAAERADKK